MKITELSKSLLEWMYDMKKKNNQVTRTSILKQFDKITVGEYRMALNYLKDEKLIDFTHLLSSPTESFEFTLFSITPLGIREAER